MEREEDRILLYSRHLYAILEFIGVSEYMRRTVQHSSTVQELIMSATQNITNDGEILSYTYKFGSSIEGTTTPGMASDIDCLICTEYPPVVEKISDANSLISYLMICDENTPPGYTKLQRIYRDEPGEQWQTDDEVELMDSSGNPVLRNKVLVESMTNDEINGPAGTTLKSRDLPGVPDLDFVPAFRCASWPSQANEWLTRERIYGFPSQEMIDRFLKYGFFLVSVGHPSSAEKNMQWRLSFSVQEREIMFNLNSTQHKCYVLLKMIKNNFIKPVVPGKSLTSYHCKTCIFYMMEQSPASIWEPDNLIQCLIRCIQMLIDWFKSGFIPNYFIPKENMWKGDAESKDKVTDALVTLLNSAPDFLEEIQTDSIGLFLTYAVVECDVIEHSTPKLLQGTEEEIADEEKSHHVDEGRCAGYDKELIDSDDDSDIVDDIVKSLLTKGLDCEEYSDSELQQAIKDELLSVLMKSSRNSDDLIEPGIDLNDFDDELVEEFTRNCATVKAVVEEVSPEKNEKTCNVKRNWSITSETDGNGEIILKLKQYPCLKVALETSKQEFDRFMYRIHFWTMNYITACARELIAFVADENIDTCITLHGIIIDRLKLESDDRITTEHTSLDRRMSAEYILPFLYTSLGSQLAAKSEQTIDSGQRYELKNKCLSLMEAGMESDAMSGILKKASILFGMGDITSAKDLLDQVDERLVPSVAAMCGCSRSKDFVIEPLRNKIGTEKLSTFEILREHVGVCVWFLPTEMSLLPKELQYEMFRSVFNLGPRTTRKSHADDWFDLVAVDSSVFLFFMLYKVHKALGNITAMKVSLAYMASSMESILNLSHLDTANNLMGCLLKERGELGQAWTCFVSSWVIRPDHNAAKWHMAIMIYEGLVSNGQLENAEVIYRRKTNNTDGY